MTYLAQYRAENADRLTPLDRERMATRRANPETNEGIKLVRRKSMKKARTLMGAISKVDPIYLSDDGLIIWQRAEEEKLRWREAAATRKARELKAMCPRCGGDRYNEIASGACWICERMPSEQTDHVIPLSNGGMHCNENFRGACEPCNKSKGFRNWPGQPGWDEFLENKRRNGNEDKE